MEYTHHKEIGARQKEQTPPVFAQVVNRPSLCKMHKHLYKYSTQIKTEILLDMLALTPPLQKKSNKSHIQPRLPSTPCICYTNTFHMHQQPHTTTCLIACWTRTRSLFKLTHLPSCFCWLSRKRSPSASAVRTDLRKCKGKHLLVSKEDRQMQMSRPPRQHREMSTSKKQRRDIPLKIQEEHFRREKMQNTLQKASQCFLEDMYCEQLT